MNDNLYMRKIFCILLATAILASCKKDETLRYNNMTMGNIQGNEIISDQGNIFIIKESLFNVDLSSFESKRVMLSCDVLRESAERTYDIRLTGITGVLTKNVKTISDSTPAEDLHVNNPFVIKEIWYSGGYLNMAIETAHKTGSETPHYINLVHEPSEGEGSAYTLILRHNAQGEVPTEEDSDFYGAVGYVSFPISRYIKEDSAKIILKWNSHKFTGNGYSLIESEDQSKEFNWERKGFEQTPGRSITPNLKQRNYL